MAGFVTQHGPIFDGRAEAAARDFCDDFEDRYAHKVEDAVRTTGQGMFKHSTGNWARHIHTAASGGDQEVNDSNLIYGPWLEGTGSRNAPKTRFKGYSTFRKVSQRMQREAGSYADTMLHRGYLGRMQ
jgi:hypothetical protein